MGSGQEESKIAQETTESKQKTNTLERRVKEKFEGDLNFRIPVCGTITTNNAAVKAAKVLFEQGKRIRLRTTGSGVDHSSLDPLRKANAEKYDLEFEPTKQGDEFREDSITNFYNQVHALLVRYTLPGMKTSEVDFNVMVGLKKDNNVTISNEDAIVLQSNASNISEIDSYNDLSEEERKESRIFARKLYDDLTPEEKTELMTTANANIMDKNFKKLVEKGIINKEGIKKNISTQEKEEILKSHNVITEKYFMSKDGKSMRAKRDDAHAAAHGYIKSRASGNIIFAAGLNKTLFKKQLRPYVELHEEFEGPNKKRISIKVSGYDSMETQTKMLAKEGLWVSEVDAESGLNCGGHAYVDKKSRLMVHVIKEIIAEKDTLDKKNLPVYKKAVEDQGRHYVEPPKTQICIQGGVKNKHEHDLITKYFGIDYTGLGTKILVVPEVSDVDEKTLEKLIAATADDLEISDYSPYGIKFNNLKTSNGTKLMKEKNAKGEYGTYCDKKNYGHLAQNNEYGVPLCTADQAYLKLKIEEIKADDTLTPEEKQAEIDKNSKKFCICKHLGTSTLVNNEITNDDKESVSCPGPVLQYFNKILTLNEFIDDLTGENIIQEIYDTPHMFVNDLKLFVYHLQNIEDKSSKEYTMIKGNLLKDIKEDMLDEDMLKSGFIPNVDVYVSQVNEQLEIVNNMP